MRLSIISAGYVMQYTLEESIEKAAEAGYDAIDLFAASPHAEPREYDKKARERLRKFVESCGLIINQYSSWGHPTTGWFAEMEGYVTAQIERLDFARDVGADHLELVPGDKLPYFPPEIPWKWAIESHKRIAEHAAKVGIPIAIEFEPIQPSQQMWGKPMPPNVYDLRTLKRFIKEVDNEYCKANLDIGHCNIIAKGNPESIRDDILALKGLIVGVHVNDNDGVTDLNAVPGTGSCDFEYYLDILKHIGYKKCISIELEGNDNPVPAAKQSLEFIKNILVKIDAYD
jgi:protein FrlC